MHPAALFLIIIAAAWALAFAWMCGVGYALGSGSWAGQCACIMFSASLVAGAVGAIICKIYYD